MWWPEFRQWRRLAGLARVAVVLAAAGLTAGCWQPLYGARPTPGAEGVQDKFAAVDIPPIIAPRGTPAERVAIGLRNALQFDLHNGGNAFAPTYQLKVNVSTSQFTAVIDPNTGRPDAQITSVVAGFQLVEMATGIVSATLHSRMSITTFRVRSSGSPGSARDATPKTTRCRSSPRRSGTDWRHTSSPEPNGRRQGFETSMPS